MAKKAKKAIPVARPVRKRYKDFMRMKFGHNATGLGPWVQRRRHRHSGHAIPTRGRRGVLREPLNMHRSEGKYAPYVALPEDRYTWFCDTPACNNVGYGPMLRTIVWQRHFANNQFLCEPCMVRKLGRPLGPRDLRNCPMNLWHPAFDLDLKVSL